MGRWSGRKEKIDTGRWECEVKNRVLALFLYGESGAGFLVATQSLRKSEKLFVGVGSDEAEGAFWIFFPGEWCV